MRGAQFRLQALLASMVAIWCGNFIALKVCLRAMSPVGVTAFRVIAAAALLLVIQRYSPGRYAFNKLRKPDYWLFLKLAFVGLLLNQVLFITGLKFTTVAHSALVVTFGPLFTLLFAWQRGQEKLTGANLFGMALSICGIFFLNLDKNLNLQTAYLVGDLLTLAGSVAFAYYTVMSKHVAAQYGSVSATTFTYLAGACVFLPVGLPAIVSVSWLAAFLGSVARVPLRGRSCIRVGAVDFLLCAAVHVRFPARGPDLSATGGDHGFFRADPFRETDTEFYFGWKHRVDRHLTDPALRPWPTGVSETRG